MELLSGFFRALLIVIPFAGFARPALAASDGRVGHQTSGTASISLVVKPSISARLHPTGFTNHDRALTVLFTSNLPAEEYELRSFSYAADSGLVEIGEAQPMTGPGIEGPVNVPLAGIPRAEGSKAIVLLAQPKI